MAELGFLQNFTNLFLINITPGEATPTWARIAAGITSAVPAGNETIEEYAYFDTEGGNTSDVTGGHEIIAFSGHRCVGDPAQDYIASLRFQYGAARITQIKWTAPNGEVVQGEVTIANIELGLGEANSREDFSFETQFNGLPSVTEGEASQFPTALTCQAVTVVAGASVSPQVTITPSGASPALVYDIDDETKATVDGDGKVHGVAAGTCNLVIKSAVKPSVQVTVQVTVSAS